MATKKKKRVKKNTKKTVKSPTIKKIEGINRVVFWAPRFLALMFIVFLSLFALDVFGKYQGREVILALFMHLIPSIIITILIILAWKWEIVGGSTLIAMGVIFGLFFDAFRDWIGFMVLVLPLWMIGILFLVDHKMNK